MGIKRNLNPFYVIIGNYNKKTFEPYNVMPYLVDRYKQKKTKDRPKTFEEFKKFVQSESMYQWWSRCEYEIIISDWPASGVEEKWDIHKQVMMNLDLITKVLMSNVI